MGVGVAVSDGLLVDVVLRCAVEIHRVGRAGGRGSGGFRGRAVLS